jgi:ParB family chromosome partitioning protein
LEFLIPEGDREKISEENDMQQQYTDIQIPLNKLALHPRNVRANSETAYSEENIKPLAANIAVRGLLQPLIVQKLEDGSFGVIGGGRRRAALNMLVDDKAAKGFTKTMKVACREVAADETALSSVSFSENALQMPMDMVERYEAFAAMQNDDGADIATIARSFAITDRQVKEALRLGNIHPEIRAAYRDNKLGLEALKAFDAHPDPQMQLETFTAIQQEYGHVDAWRVRSAFKNRFVRAGDALGEFVLEEYRAAGGDIVSDLIEEDSVLSDDTLINKLLEQKLGDLAEQKREELGFAWSEARIDVEWDTFSDYGRVYPIALELDEETQAKADQLIERMDAVAEESEGAEDFDEQCRLDDQHEALNAEYEQLTTGYSESDRANAGVIAVWERGNLNFRIGFVRPEDLPEEENSGKAPSTAAGVGESEAGPTGPKISAKLNDDMAHVRTRAVGLALAQSPELARDYADFTLIRQVIGRSVGYVRNSTTISASKANRGPLEPVGSLQQIEAVFENLYDGLETDWMDLEPVESFAAFRELDAEARGALLAYAVAETLDPLSASDLRGSGRRDPIREAVEREAMPNVRDIWTPDEAFLNRLTKPDLVQVLRDVDMAAEASVYAEGRKSNLVTYMDKLFAEPFATLTDTQRAAVTSWAPDLMAHTAIEEEVAEVDEPSEPEGELAIAAE